MSKIITLPELGDNITGGTIISFNFSKDEMIEIDETLMEIETDKAVIPIPAKEKGMIEEIFVKEGEDININDKILSLKVEEKVVEKSVEKENIEVNKDQSFHSSIISLSELGDDIKGGTIISVSVSIGDTIENGDTILEIETEKAVVPFPASFSGKVANIFVKEGEDIEIGAKLVEIQSIKESSESSKKEATSSQKSNEKSNENNKSKKQESKEVLQVNNSSSFSNIISYQKNYSILASPSTRKLARELNVDLSLVKGSLRNGRIDQKDVKAYVKSLLQSSNNQQNSSLISSKDLPNFAEFGEIRKEKTSKLRQIISKQMSYSWNNIPHVHHYDEFNISRIEALKKTYGEDFKEKGSSFSVTLFFIKALAQCIKEFPIYNSSFNEKTQEIIYKSYYNVGVAVDTPNGLIVPVIKDVNDLSIFSIGKVLKELAKETRNRTIAANKLKGASITLSNLGGIGGGHFNPIINWPEVSIVGIGRNAVKPVFIKESFQPRSLVPICIAYDHRVIDGAVNARFLIRLKEMIEHPETLLMGVEK